MTDWLRDGWMASWNDRPTVHPTDWLTDEVTNSLSMRSTVFLEKLGSSLASHAFSAIIMQAFCSAHRNSFHFDKSYYITWKNHEVLPLYDIVMWNKILHQSAEFYMWSTNAFLFLNKNRILHLCRLCQGTEIFKKTKTKRNSLPFTIKDVYIPDVMCNVSTAKLSALLLCMQTINEIAMKGKVPTELLFCVCVCVCVCAGVAQSSGSFCILP